MVIINSDIVPGCLLTRNEVRLTSIDVSSAECSAQRLGPAPENAAPPDLGPFRPEATDEHRDTSAFGSPRAV